MDLVPSGSRDTILSRRVLFDVMLSSASNKFEERCKVLLEYVAELTNCPDGSLHELKKKLSHFSSEFKAKWKTAQYKKERFLDQNKTWLEANISFSFYSSTPSTSGGRPPIDFLQSSERSKRRKTVELRSKSSSSELVYAAQMSLRAEGNLDAATVVKEMKFSTPTRAKKYRRAYSKKDKQIIELSGDAALSVLVEAKLTVHQYNIIREQDKDRFPSYKKVLEAKKRCYPGRNAITITGRSAEVNLQAILDHTVERILNVQKEVIDSLTEEQVKSMTLICKWGCDGSSGHSQYKQKFDDDEEGSDENVFVTSFVPLQLISGDLNSPKTIIVWKNPRPSSPRFCRPIRLQFVHETNDITVQEKNYIEGQINGLYPSSVTIDQREINVTHNMLFTMIDGKVCNAASSNKSTQRCYICGSTSKSFNNIDLMLQQNVDSVKFEFGLSTLHGWIRFFECLLHLAYKLPIKTWQARGDENKRIVAETKKKIQNDFKSKMGLLVDRPKPGFGSSNDGNTARRFFEDPQLSSEITGINIDVIKRFKVVLQTISSGYHVNTEMFHDYCITTARLFVEHYPWFCMPTTVHKILIHGPDVISSAILPIGQLSEDAQESLNKEIKKNREQFSRKCSRDKTLEDVFNRLLISSDPHISSLRKLPRRKSKSFSPEVLALLLPPEIDDPNLDDSEDSSMNSDSSDEDNDPNESFD